MIILRGYGSLEELLEMITLAQLKIQYRLLPWEHSRSVSRSRSITRFRSWSTPRDRSRSRSGSRGRGRSWLVLCAFHMVLARHIEWLSLRKELLQMRLEWVELILLAAKSWWNRLTRALAYLLLERLVKFKQASRLLDVDKS
ncbi:cytokinin riboside 5'-monophosphatephosphoribohydrolase LOG1 [Striga asiatica]|uniref:Cytokinin riboside 5'-monophosphatephosphoribohydrolase LOG1 n=1 Tax=Striga asiatica TaxID=4170 RepID=A0A5A7PNJ5_STRAF|nr:cytokinin riboside 5'-monophosphatephosphoribohydrolase LOG1 [Striga asiatica]